MQMRQEQLSVKDVISYGKNWAMIQWDPLTYVCADRTDIDDIYCSLLLLGGLLENWKKISQHYVCAHDAHGPGAPVIVDAALSNSFPWLCSSSIIDEDIQPPNLIHNVTCCCSNFGFVCNVKWKLVTLTLELIDEIACSTASSSLAVRAQIIMFSTPLSAYRKAIERPLCAIGSQQLHVKNVSWRGYTCLWTPWLLRQGKIEKDGLPLYVHPSSSTCD